MLCLGLSIPRRLVWRTAASEVHHDLLQATVAAATAPGMRHGHVRTHFCSVSCQCCSGNGQPGARFPTGHAAATAAVSADESAAAATAAAGAAAGTAAGAAAGAAAETAAADAAAADDAAAASTAAASTAAASAAAASAAAADARRAASVSADAAADATTVAARLNGSRALPFCPTPVQ